MNAPIASWSAPEFIAALSDDGLHAGVRVLVGRSNQVLATLLAHLAEVEARGIHRERACSSLYTYCIYELRMAEDAAFKRSRAAAVARRFPAIFGMVAAGEIHLSGVVMLAPHLTDENHAGLLARAKHRTKREIAKLLADVAPRPEVPALIEPLGPQLGRAPSSWESLVASLTGFVRERPLGPAPRDWVSTEEEVVESEAQPEEIAAPEREIAPQRYKVQFTAGQEFVDLLEQARDLLARDVPGRDLAEIQLRAMRALVAELRKKKQAAAGEKRQGDTAPLRSGDAPVVSGRTIPAVVRREVWKRDGTRCAFVDDRGSRCRETSRLELHHRVPFARGGPPTAENIELRCRAHNVLAAEQDFGRDFVRERSGSG